MGWVIPASVCGGNFSTSFDSMGGLSIISGEESWTVPFHYKAPWPGENTHQNKAYFFSSGASGGIRMARDMERFDTQAASVEFLAPDGISDHLDIGVQGYFVPKVCIAGYFAILGFDRRLCGNSPDHPCSQLHLGVEKATCTTNWIYSGKPVTLHPDKTYRIQIRTERYQNRTRVTAKLFGFDRNVPRKPTPVAGRLHAPQWVLIQETHYDDYPGDDDGDPLTGGVAWFGPIMHKGRIYFDHFKVDWN